MIILIDDSESGKLQQNADMVLSKTDEIDWKGDRLYRITKNRFGEPGSLVPERNIQELSKRFKLQDWKEPQLN